MRLFLTKKLANNLRLTVKIKKVNGTQGLSSKHPNFEIFRNRAIRHIQTAIRHMWRVANGLDNDELAHTQNV